MTEGFLRVMLTQGPLIAVVFISRVPTSTQNLKLCSPTSR